ncbi:MAG: hypothetical protein ACM3ZF_16735, partial [Mycobacterium leprae]
MGQDPTPLLDEFRAWLAGRDEVPPVTATEPYHYSYDEDLDRFGRVVSERRGGEDIRTPLPGPVSTRDVDVAVLRAILDRHPQSPFTWEPGELTDAVQRYVERGTLGPDGLARIVPTIVPTLRAFLRFGAAEHPNASSDLGVLASEDDLDDAEVLVGLAMQLGGVAHPASARIARSRAIVTVDRYALKDFRLPLAVGPTVPTGIAQVGAATSAGLAVLRDVVGCVGGGSSGHRQGQPGARRRAAARRPARCRAPREARAVDARRARRGVRVSVGGRVDFPRSRQRSGRARRRRAAAHHRPGRRVPRRVARPHHGSDAAAPGPALARAAAGLRAADAARPARRALRVRRDA